MSKPRTIELKIINSIWHDRTRKHAQVHGFFLKNVFLIVYKKEFWIKLSLKIEGKKRKKKWKWNWKRKWFFFRPHLQEKKLCFFLNFSILLLFIFLLSFIYSWILCCFVYFWLGFCVVMHNNQGTQNLTPGILFYIFGLFVQVCHDTERERRGGGKGKVKFPQCQFDCQLTDSGLCTVCGDWTVLCYVSYPSLTFDFLSLSFSLSTQQWQQEWERF